jgi:hypothetical protein
MPEIIHPEWRKHNEPTKYPFAEESSLRSGNDLILNELFLDAIFYPVGNDQDLRLSVVEVEHDSVTLYIGTTDNEKLASGTFNQFDPPSKIELTDSLGRAAGLIVSEPLRLAIFQSWSLGSHSFTTEEAGFAATVSIPSPEIGLRGFVLEDGTLFTGDIWLVGDDGVVIRKEMISVPTTECDQGEVTEHPVIRIDVVGDTLFRRRLCTDAALFVTPRYVEQLTFVGQGASFSCTPDILGDIKMLAGNHLAEDTVLRVRTTEGGIVIEAVGERTDIGT